ncbi:hypothetical protein LMG28138_05811 [Pararobbsia alpina]|uniref:Uncharacterized protein n=1 Tax=Pararobbsia alpina TaxID=621374 RepID=A0A6S7BPG9_9BURK|nr:hypothetical protein LMG28138_05811 [Pararobbsia alpina]
MRLIGDVRNRAPVAWRQSAGATLACGEPSDQSALTCKLDAAETPFAVSHGFFALFTA